MSHPPTRILLIEDNPRDVFVFREAVATSRGATVYHVDHSGTLEDALRRLAIERFDLIMLDLTLPDSRGYETFEKVKSLARSSPIILMTAVEDDQMASRAVREGAQDYLVKSQLSAALIVHCMRYAVERHRTREDLRVSSEKLQRLNLKYQAVLRSTPNGLCMLNSYWKITYANPAMQQLFGAQTDASSEGVSGIEFSELFHSNEAFEQYQQIAMRDARMQGLHRQELQLKSQDGRMLWCDVALTRIDPSETASGYAVTIIDITQRKIEQAQREWLAAAVEQATEAIMITDTNWRIEYVNPAFERITGFSQNEMIGKQPQLSLHSGNYDELFRDATVKAIESDGHWSGRFASRRKDGNAYEEEVHIRPICDTDGSPKHYVLVRHDITREVSLESELRQSQKMEAIGLLAGGIAHDFNNILQVVIGQSDLLLFGLKPGEPMREDLERIVSAGKRGAALTRQLLAFSRKQSMLPQVMDLNRAVTEVAKLLARLIGEDIHLDLDLQENLSPVSADPAQLEQVMINLAVNARDAMPRGGRVTITTRAAQLDDEFARKHVDIEPGDYIQLSVADTGVGMDPETMARVFDPFFTTKDVGRGTGLGLSMAYGIVRQCGGQIFVSSKKDHGTTFDIYLPQTDAVVDANETPFFEDDSTPRHQTILVVEDEPDVCDLVRLLLEQAGYNVLTASNGKEALLVASFFQGTIHLLLTDVVMPEKNGAELAQELLKTRPQTRVLFMSGYTEHAVSQRNLLAPGTPLIQKPFGPHLLISRVREVIEEQQYFTPRHGLRVDAADTGVQLSNGRAETVQS